MAEVVDRRSLRYRHRRAELLVAVGEYVLENGVATLTLRGAADAVGVTHATLQHHFGSREQLLEEIIEHLLERSFAPGEDYPVGATVAEVEVRLRELWSSLRTPAGGRDIRLFTEVLVQGLYTGPNSEPAVTRSIGQRLERIAGIMVSLGCPESEAMACATAMLAMLRGITLDLLATGEDERVRSRAATGLELLLIVGSVACTADGRRQPPIVLSSSANSSVKCRSAAASS